MKTGFDMSCKVFPIETICMKCQILFPGKIITYLSSAELDQRVVKVKVFCQSIMMNECLSVIRDIPEDHNVLCERDIRFSRK